MVMWALETKLVQSKGYGSPWLLDTVITPFLPTGFSRVSARKTRQPEPSRPDPTKGSSPQILPKRRSGTHFPRTYESFDSILYGPKTDEKRGSYGPKLRKNGPTLSQILLSVVDKTAYLGGNVCAKILSDPLQLGPRAKTLRQEVHFSYHTQLSDRQELLRSSRNLSQKMTPWHKEHSDGLCSQGSYLANPSSPLCKACTVEKVFLTRNKLIREPGHVGKKTHPCTTWNSRIAKILSGLSRNPDRKTALKRTKNTPVASVRGTISHEAQAQKDFRTSPGAWDKIWKNALGWTDFPASRARRGTPATVELSVRR
uniref:Uncharacterized protein n=1 Tax=Fagus sylvatica TaxID=28930 RepID=A0A2N9HCA1_FAGSY